MSIFGLAPYRGSDVQSYFDDFEKRFFGAHGAEGRTFRTDILDKGDSFVLEAELPGFKKEDISVSLEGDYLTIEAKRDEKRDESRGSYVRRERSYSSYVRSFDMTGIDVSGIDGKYENGILEVTLPKQKETPAQQRRIEIQ